MLFQLGNKVYEGLFAPDGYNISGNEANLAEYALIGTKPRLQHTGVTLEEVSLSLQLRGEYCDPKQEIADLEQWKTDGEVLPLLLGNGDYVNDYVLKGIGKNIVQTLADGTIVEARLDISLLEFVPYSEEAQQESGDRNNAAAVGDKEQVQRRPEQPPTTEAAAHQNLMEAQNKAWEAANDAGEAMESADPESFIDKVKNGVEAAQGAMDKAKDKINEGREQINNATGIIAAIENAGEELGEIGGLMSQPISLYNLGQSVANLQNGLRGLDRNSSVFTNDIVLRKP